MIRKWLVALLALLVLGVPGRTSGSVDVFPEGATLNASQLAQIRRNYLMAEAQGPYHSLHLRYRDVWKGQKRTFLWSAQSFSNPGGGVAYAVVLRQTQPKPVNLVLGGTASLNLKDFGGEDPDDRYIVVYQTLDAYLKSHKVEGNLKP